MTKRLKSKYHVCKRVKGLHRNLWGVVKATNFRSIKILKRNVFTIKQKLNRLSSFGKLLNTKQNLKNFYCNLSENSFQQVLRKSIKSETKTIEKFFSILESRLDIILYRACFVNSIHMARQLINHGIVFVNNQCIKTYHFTVTKQDTIQLKINDFVFYKKLIYILKQRRFKLYFQFFFEKIHPSNYSVIKCLNLNKRKLTFLLKKILLRKYKSLFVNKLKKNYFTPFHLETNFQLLTIIYLWDPVYKNLHYPVKSLYKKHSNSEVYSLNEILYSQKR